MSPRWGLDVCRLSISINMPPRWGYENQVNRIYSFRFGMALGFTVRAQPNLLPRQNCFFSIYRALFQPYTHVAPPGLGCWSLEHFYKHVAPLGLENREAEPTLQTIRVI